MRRLEMVRLNRELDQSDRRTGTAVFLLGAGCSVQSGIPVMKDFMLRAHDLFLSVEKIPKLWHAYKRAFQYQRTQRGINATFERSWDDVEQLMTQAEISTLGGDGIQDDSDPDDSVTLSVGIARMIWDVCRRSTIGDYEYFGEALRKLAQRWRANDSPRPVVITTNYDVGLETGITAGGTGDEGIVAYNAMDVAGAGRHFIHAYEITKRKLNRGDLGWYPIQVLKLHGSANWFVENTKVTCVCQGPDGDKDQWIKTIQGNAIVDTLCNTKRPLIVPPLLKKLVEEEVVTAQWTGTMAALRNARELYVVGYSFPETDAFMSRLLAEGLSLSAHLKRFVIINPDTTETWWERIRRMFSRSFWENRVYCATNYFDAFAKTLVRWGHASKDPSIDVIAFEQRRPEKERWLKFRK